MHYHESDAHYIELVATIFDASWSPRSRWLGLRVLSWTKSEQKQTSFQNLFVHSWCFCTTHQHAKQDISSTARASFVTRGFLIIHCVYWVGCPINILSFLFIFLFSLTNSVTWLADVYIFSHTSYFIANTQILAVSLIVHILIGNMLLLLLAITWHCNNIQPLLDWKLQYYFQVILFFKYQSFFVSFICSFSMRIFFIDRCFSLPNSLYPSTTFAQNVKASFPTQSAPTEKGCHSVDRFSYKYFLYFPLHFYLG